METIRLEDYARPVSAPLPDFTNKEADLGFAWSEMPDEAEWDDIMLEALLDALLAGADIPILH